MSRAPTVSVIMPFLDMERFIIESIESVRAQTRGDWELLLVDDGSTDGSAEIANRYAAADPVRIRVLRHGGSRGASAARNVGLAHARGEFIGLLDADDIWVPHKLEEQLAFLEQDPGIDLVYGRTMWWYSWADQPTDTDHVPGLGIHARRIPGPRLLELMLRNAAEMLSTCSVIIRRSAIEAAGGFEDEFRYIYTDQVFFAKLLLNASVLPVDRCWDWYRRRRDSSSSLGPRELAEARIRYLEWLARYIDRSGRREPRLVRTVRREIMWARMPEPLQRLHRTMNRLPGRARALLQRFRTDSNTQE